VVDLGELAERTVGTVMRLGPDACDVLVSNSRQITAEIEKGSMKQASVVEDPGVAIRVFKHGSPGFAYCTGFDSQDIKRMAALAVSQASAGTPDIDFKGLPDARRPAKVGGMFEKKLAELEPDEAVSMAIELAEIAGRNKRVSSVNAGVSIGAGEVVLANSNGICSCQEMTTFEISAEAVAKSGSNMFSGVDGGWSRRYDGGMIESVGTAAREQAILGLSHSKIETGDMPVVIGPLALGFVLSSAIGGGANADSVQRKRSYLTGKLGTKIGSGILSVADDPTLRWGFGSYSFDGEGTPSSKRSVLDAGILRTYLHDSYTAGKESVQSTGNSSRGGGLWSFRRPPSISSSNLVVSQGNASLEEMIRETRNGVYLRVTYDYPNLATGELSGLMMESYKIEKGELGRSIRQATIGIGLLELFSRVDMVGRESRYAFGLQTPAIRVSKARIAGSV